MNYEKENGKFINYTDEYDMVQAFTLSHYEGIIKNFSRDNWEGVSIYSDMDMKACGKYSNINDLPFKAFREGDIFSVVYHNDDYIFMINDEKEVILVRDDFYCKYQYKLEINLNRKQYKVLRTYKLLEKHCPKLL
jgi:hypothetical protein